MSYIFCRNAPTLDFRGKGYGLNMKVSRCALLLLSTLVLVPLTWAYFHFYPVLTQTEQVRYRITATIDTPRGPRTGSGVWGMFLAPVFGVPVWSFRWNFSPRNEGETFPIDLGDGRVIYAVMGSRDTNRSGSQVFFNTGLLNILPQARLQLSGYSLPYRGNNREGAIKTIAQLKAMKGIVVSLHCSSLPDNDLGDCPALVQADRAGKRVKMFDPDDLVTPLGAGYRLRGMTAEIVDQPITHGIQFYLPWAKAPTPYDQSTGQGDVKRMGFIRRDPARWD